MKRTKVDSPFYGCHNNRRRRPLSPKQIAIAAGRDRYLPTKPCPMCKQLAERFLNGRCTGCYPPEK